MFEEDQHTLHKYESLHSMVKRSDPDFTCLTQKKKEAARSVLQQLHLVAEGTGVAGMPSEAGDGSVQAFLTPTRPELKGLGDWDTVRGSAIDMGAVGSACKQFQSMNEYRVAGSFRLDQEQWNFELQMMGVRWFRAGVRA